MTKITDVIKSPIKGKTGTINRSSGYEYRDFYYTPAGSKKKVHVVGWHRAIDITTLGTVVAFATGKVVSVVKGITGQTTNPSGGNSVTLLHANGVKTTYCHLDNGSNNHLKVGDILKEGEKIGTDIIKTTGNSTGLHLHFAIYDPNNTYKDSHYMNPEDYLKGKKKIVGYPIPGPKPSITPTVQRDTTKNQLVTNMSMNIRLGIETTSESIGVVPKGNIYNYYEVKQGKSSKWYAITPDKTQWIAGVNNNGTKYCIILPGVTPKPTPEPPKPTPTKLKVGDKVKIVGTGNGSSYGTGNIAGGIGWTREILKIWSGRAYPYQVGNKNGTTGFYKESALKKI